VLGQWKIFKYKSRDVLFQFELERIAISIKMIEIKSILDGITLSVEQSAAKLQNCCPPSLFLIIFQSGENYSQTRIARYYVAFFRAFKKIEPVFNAGPIPSPFPKTLFPVFLATSVVM